MRRAVTIAAGACGLVLLAACSGTTSTASRAPGVPVPKLAPAPAGGLGVAAPTVNAAGAGGQQVNGLAASASTAGTLTADLPGPSVIKTASLQVEFAKAGDVAAKADAAESVVIGLGGSVYADNRTSGDSASADLTLKVPPDSLTQAIDRIAALGHEVSRESSSKDVTTEVADVDSRVRSAQDSLTRLRLLYSQASKIGDILELESQISQREADLEALQAQQRALAAQTTMATLQVSLTTKGTAPPPPPKPRHYKGFAGGLHHGWDAFTSSVSAVATAVGAALPFGVLFLALGAVAVLFRRRRRPVPEPDHA